MRGKWCSRKQQEPLMEFEFTTYRSRRLLQSCTNHCHVFILQFNLGHLLGQYTYKQEHIRGRKTNLPHRRYTWVTFYFLLHHLHLFSVILLSVLCGHSVFPSPPQRPMTSNFEGFLYQILSIKLFSCLNSWKRASTSLFQCWVLNKGSTGTILITSLVWRGPWLGIEPGTSRTQSQHSTIRLSRKEAAPLK